MLDRREFLAASAAAALSGIARAGEQRKPNVLFLISDQHRADVSGFAGDDLALTPELDALARAGTVLETMYCQAPLCVPARQSLITGTYAHQHGSFRNWTDFPSAQRTLAHEFAGAGYRTALFGKAHCNTSGFETHVSQTDFLERFQAEHENGKRAGQRSIRSGESALPKDLRAMNPDAEGPGQGPVFHMEQAVTAAVTEFLEGHKGDQPFFLWASLLSPHPPLFPPQAFMERFAERALPLDEFTGDEPLDDGLARHRKHYGLDQLTREQWLGLKRSYYASVAWMDSCVGEILRTLDACKLAEDTLVVYTSDHGEMLGEHGRVQKGVFFEGAVRVPCIVRLPGTVRAAGRIAQVTEHVDLAATLFDLTSQARPEGYVGRSLARLLATGRDLSWENVALSEKVDGRHTLEMPVRFLHQMLRRDQFKYMRFGILEEALFDLNADPRERTNLVERPEHRNRLLALREELRERSPEMVSILGAPERGSKR